MHVDEGDRDSGHDDDIGVAGDFPVQLRREDRILDHRVRRGWKGKDAMSVFFAVGRVVIRL